MVKALEQCDECGEDTLKPRLMHREDDNEIYEHMQWCNVCYMQSSDPSWVECWCIGAKSNG